MVDGWKQGMICGIGKSNPTRAPIKQERRSGITTRNRNVRPYVNGQNLMEDK